MPFILNTLSVVGTAAMLWVGGHLIVHNTHLIGMNFLHHIDHAIVGLLPTNEVVTWFGTTTVSLLVALTLGTVLVSVFTLFQKLRSAK